MVYVEGEDLVLRVVLLFLSLVINNFVCYKVEVFLFIGCEG